jgi:hypothetical protein
VSRGKRKPKLRDLSINPLTYDELTNLLDALGAQTSPLSKALLGAALVEHDLDNSLRGCLKIKTDAEWEGLVDERGPLSSFSRKIQMGRALRIYDSSFQTNLDVIRNVRNAFAHSKRLITFDHELVQKELARIKPLKNNVRKYKRFSHTRAETIYEFLCLNLANAFSKKRNSALSRRSKRARSKLLQYSDFYKTLSPVLNPHGHRTLADLPMLLGTSEKSPQRLFQLGQTLNPSPEPPTGLLGEALRSSSKELRSKDK